MCALWSAGPGASTMALRALRVEGCDYFTPLIGKITNAPIKQATAHTVNHTV